MTQEYADRRMTKAQEMRLDEVHVDAFDRMKDNQKELAENLEQARKDREQYPDMVIPTDDMIRDIHHGEMTDSEMRDRADEIARATVEREAQEAAREQQNSRRSFAEKMEQSKGHDAIEQARTDTRQEQELEQKQEREQGI